MKLVVSIYLEKLLGFYGIIDHDGNSGTCNLFELPAQLKAKRALWESRCRCRGQTPCYHVMQRNLDVYFRALVWTNVGSWAKGWDGHWGMLYYSVVSKPNLDNPLFFSETKADHDIAGHTFVWRYLNSDRYLGKTYALCFMNSPLVLYVFTMF